MHLLINHSNMKAFEGLETKDILFLAAFLIFINVVGIIIAQRVS